MLKGIDFQAPGTKCEAFKKFILIAEPPASKGTLFIDFSISVLMLMDFSLLKKALSISLKEGKAFSNIFGKNNPKFAEKLTKLVDAAKKGLIPPSAKDLLKKKTDVNVLMKMSNEAKLGVVLDAIQKGNISEQTCADIGSNVQKELEAKSAKSEVESEIQAKLANKDPTVKASAKLQEAVAVKPTPEVLAKAVGEMLGKLSPEEVAESLAAVLADSPALDELMETIAKVDKLHLKPEEMRKVLKDNVKDFEKKQAQAAILNSTDQVDAIDDSVATNIVKSLKAVDSQPAEVAAALKEEKSNVEILQNIASANLAAVVNEEIVADMLKIVDAMTDEQVKNSFKMACAEPQFLEAVNKEFKDKLAALAESEKAKVDATQALAGLKLSPAQMKEALTNANKFSSEFAIATACFASESLGDEDAKKALGVLTNGMGETTNSEVTDTLSSISNSPKSDQEKICEICKSEKLKASLDPSVKKTANEALASLDETQTAEGVFAPVSADSALVKILLEANPDLAGQVKCVQFPDQCANLYDCDGTAVPTSADMTKEQLEKLVKFEKKGAELVSPKTPGLSVSETGMIVFKEDSP